MELPDSQKESGTLSQTLPKQNYFEKLAASREAEHTHMIKSRTQVCVLQKCVCVCVDTFFYIQSLKDVHKNAHSSTIWISSKYPSTATQKPSCSRVTDTEMMHLPNLILSKVSQTHKEYILYSHTKFRHKQIHLWVQKSGQWSSLEEKVLEALSRVCQAQ